jgi:hypothetical protein
MRPSESTEWLRYYNAIWPEAKLELPPSPTREPLNKGEIERRWHAERQQLSDALGGLDFSVTSALIHPHLSSLEAFIINASERLGEQKIFVEALAYLQAMQDDPIALNDNPLAVVVGFEELRVALDIIGNTSFLRPLADAQLKYMNAHPIWREFLERIRRGTHPNAPPEDYIPGGLPEPDEYSEEDDPFSG